MTERDPHQESLDRLLSHLTAVEPDDGFNERTLRRIAARRLALSRGRHPRLRWYLASATVVACALAFAFVGDRHSAAPAPSVVSPPPAAIPPPRVAIFQQTAAHRRGSRGHAVTQLPTQLDFPAPEAPLTAEEKLLLRVAHHPDPDQVALLNPEERAELELRDQVQFQQFFDPEPRPRKDHN
jgi:hypothetical protein